MVFSYFLVNLNEEVVRTSNRGKKIKRSLTTKFFCLFILQLHICHDAQCLTVSIVFF